MAFSEKICLSCCKNSIRTVEYERVDFILRGRAQFLVKELSFCPAFPEMERMLSTSRCSIVAGGLTGFYA